MTDSPFLLLPLREVPSQPNWLGGQSVPVIAVGKGETPNADVVLLDEQEVDSLLANIERAPLAAMTLVQVLRTVETLPVEQGITVESLAYATLQVGPEYLAWLETRADAPQRVIGSEGEPIALHRNEYTIYAELNRAEHRNALSVEMRDALVELFELVLADDSIEQVHLSGRGACFSVGGEIREFGLAPDAATAHHIRTVHNPSRLIARVADKIHCHLHSACIGSGIEIPAFAARVTVAPNAFFQLPELSFGLIPGAGGCVSLSRRIGRQRTAWLALTGKKINARTALAWGLIDDMVADQSRE